MNSLSDSDSGGLAQTDDFILVEANRHCNVHIFLRQTLIIGHRQEQRAIVLGDDRYLPPLRLRDQPGGAFDQFFD